MPCTPPPRLSPDNCFGPRRYFLTICTHLRLAFFSKAEFVAPAIDQLRECSREHEFAVIAYCFMPDHVHMLVEGLEDRADLREFVRVWKQHTAFCLRRQCGIRLWQRGYYEHILRSDESAVDRAQYVITNPVRAGLVQNPLKYPWSGSFVTSVEELLERAQHRRASVRGPT
jgi:putative transposase